MIAEDLIGKQVTIKATFRDDNGRSLLGDRGVIISSEEDRLTINAYQFVRNRKVDRFVTMPPECVEVH